MATIEVGKTTFQGVNVRQHPDALGLCEVTAIFKAVLEEEDQAAKFDRYVPGALRSFSAGNEDEASNVTHSDINTGVQLIVTRHEDTVKAFSKGDPLAKKGNVIFDHKAEFKKITLSCKGRGKSYVKLTFKLYVSDLSDVMFLGLHCGDVVDLETQAQQVALGFLKQPPPPGVTVHTGPL